MTNASRSVIVLAPMRMELRPVVRLLHGARRQVGADTVHTARRGDVNVDAALIGVGPTIAGAATERLVDALRPDHVVVCGVAGGLAPDRPIGSVIVPESVIDLASGAAYRPAAIGDTAAAGVIATAAELILDRERLAAIAAQGVIAIDMETAAVGAVCERRGVVWSAFRSISDRPSDEVVDDSVMGLLRPDGSADAWATLRLVARKPRQIPRLARLGRDSSTAANAAARAAVAAATAG